MTKTKNIFYGWWIVAGCFGVTAVTVGIAINSFSMFYSPIVKDFGFELGAFSFTSSVIALLVMVGAVLVGELIKRANIRLIMTVSGLAYGTGLILFSQCRNLTQFYLAAALVGLGGAGTYLVPVSFLITQWFQEKRGLAMGIALTGSGVGGMICGPLSNWLIMTSSWQMALVVLGIISLAIIIPFSLFIVRLTPSEMGLLPYGCLGSHQEEEGRAESGLSLRQAVKTSSFWLLGLAFIIIGILIMGVQMHIPGYLENVGHTSTFAAYVVGFTNGLLILGKPILGGIHDKFGTKAGAFYIFIVYILTLAVLIGAKSTLAAGLFTVLFGFAAAIATLTIPLWTLEVLGKKEFVTIYPIMNIFFTLGAAVGSPLTGLVFDAQGSYLYAWVIYIGLSVVGLMLALAAYSRRQVDIAKEVALNNPGNLQY